MSAKEIRYVDESSKGWDDKYDMYKYIASVQSNIKSYISSDFVQAKLNDTDKEFVIEMVTNAFFVKRICMNIGNDLDENNNEYILNLANIVFDSIITKLYMIVILNRNVSMNYILKLLTSEPEKQDDIMNVENELKVKGKLKKVLQNEESRQVS